MKALSPTADANGTSTSSSSLGAFSVGGTIVWVGKVPISWATVSASSCTAPRVGEGTSVGTAISGSSVGERADSDNAPLASSADSYGAGTCTAPGSCPGELSTGEVTTNGSGGSRAASGNGPMMASSSSSPGPIDVGDGLAVGTGRSAGDDGTAVVAGREPVKVRSMVRSGTGISVGEGRSVGTGSSLGDCVAAEDDTAAAEECTSTSPPTGTTSEGDAIGEVIGADSGMGGGNSSSKGPGGAGAVTVGAMAVAVGMAVVSSQGSPSSSPNEVGEIISVGTGISVGDADSNTEEETTEEPSCATDSGASSWPGVSRGCASGSSGAFRVGISIAVGISTSSITCCRPGEVGEGICVGTGSSVGEDSTALEKGTDLAGTLLGTAIDGANSVREIGRAHV